MGQPVQRLLTATGKKYGELLIAERELIYYVKSLCILGSESSA
jgi:hypothetical protein